jgi:hypothetical protein
MTNLRTLALGTLALLAAASLGGCKPKPTNATNSAEAANSASKEAAPASNGATADAGAPKDTSSKTTSKVPY